ncbi:MAG: LysR family transcriptional regulator [Gordonia sp. (in: high G+C Gram-positive bacteria)]
MSDVLDIVALRSLTGVADAGGFRRAAQSLHLSQSAISAHIRRLELACNQTLIDRKAKGLRFTSAGALLVADARVILAAHDDALSRARGSLQDANVLTVGATEHGAERLLPIISAALGAAYPEYTVRFRLDRGQRLVGHLDAGDLDAALLLGPAICGDQEPAGALPLTWFAAHGWQRPAQPETPLPVVAIEGPCTIREHALRALAEHRIPSTVVCEAGHLAGVVNAARAGLGVALLAHLGRSPEDLEPRLDLPAVDDQPLHVRTRRQAPSDLRATIADALLGSPYFGEPSIRAVS